MRIFEYYRKTLETYIYIQINLDGFYSKNINISTFFLKHMIEQMVLNGFLNLNIIALGDNMDYHHITEDIGILIGYALYNSLTNKNEILRYGYSYVSLDDTLSRVVIDCCNRAFLKYNINYNRLYIGNFDINLFYEFFISLVNNFKINLYIDNFYGNNPHHKIESVFKALGRALKTSIKKNKKNINSTKGIL